MTKGNEKAVKYCKKIIGKTGAEAVFVVVIGGKHGNGMCLQYDDDLKDMPLIGKLSEFCYQLYGQLHSAPKPTISELYEEYIKNQATHKAAEEAAIPHANKEYLPTFEPIPDRPGYARVVFHTGQIEPEDKE